MLANRYELIRKVGTGGMAVVYQAYDTSLDRQVAIKLLKEEYVDDPDFIRQFQKEAKAVARLSHQNIVNIYDFGESDGVTYLVMEYVEGSTLKEIIERSGALPISQVIDYSIQLCRGLAQAHNQQVVHKDIKPHNIIVDRHHDVKITDFGIAQAMNNLTITHNKGILGSAHYFSPEQARGDIVDFKSDMYSLGIVMYEMLIGRVPFTGDNPVTVALKHLQEKPQSLVMQRPDVPPELENIVFRALEKEPNKRYHDMEEMADALTVLKASIDKQGAIPKEPVIAKAEAKPEEVKKPEPAAVVNPANDETRIMNNDYLKDSEDVSPRERKKKRKNTMIIVLVILALFFGTFLAVQLFFNRGDVAVPDIVNMTPEEAEEYLEEFNLKLEVEDERSDADVEKGRIIEQDPEANELVKEGRTIHVVVSMGAEDVEVPELEGLSESEAKVELENLGLELGRVTWGNDPDMPADVVIRQSVRPGKEVEPGTRVNIELNKGEEEEEEDEEVSVPSLKGKKLNDAIALLRAAGLEEGQIHKTSSKEFYSDYVLDQGIAAGSKVTKGTSISLTVSSGPGPESEASSQFDVIVPEDGHVVATVSDSNGTKVVFEKDCAAGDRIQQSFTYKGKGSITINCNGKEIWSKSL